MSLISVATLYGIVLFSVQDRLLISNTMTILCEHDDVDEELVDDPD